MRPAPQPLTLHARCRVAHVGPGEVLFVGQTSFAAGLWVGIHLDEPVGKNDGSVQGKRYFDCVPGHGLFVRPSQVQPEEAPQPVRMHASEPRRRPDPPSRPRTISAPRQARGVEESPSVARTARIRARQSLAAPRDSPSTLRSQVLKSPETARTTTPSRTPQTPRSTLLSRPAAHTPMHARETPFKTPAESPRMAKPAESPRAVSPDTQDKKLRAQITLLETQKAAADARIAELEAAAARAAEKSAGKEAEAADSASALAAERDSLREQLQQANEGLEMATLDREMAEERADAIATELRSVRDMAEELTLELQLRDDDTQGGTDASLAQQNGRLRQALIRLREMSAETESALTSEIASLRRDLAALDGASEACSAAKAAEAQATAVAAELRTQLELAHGAEDMIEQLTDKNGALDARVSQLTAEVRDLESLRTVSDELEQAHIDTEAELHDALDAQAARVTELESTVGELHARIADDAHTIARFRELVASLAREAESLRKAPTGTHKPVVDVVAARAPLVSVAPARDRIATAQAVRRVDLVQAYLPARFFQVDAAAIDTLLFFERIYSHSDLIKHTLEAQTDVQEHLVHADEALIAACELRHALAHVSALARQISAVLSSAPPEIFASYAATAADMQHVDVRLNAALDALHDDRFDEHAVAADCGAIVPQLEAVSMSLADIESVADLAAKEVGSATLLVHDIDTLQAALAYTRRTIQQLADDDDIQFSAEALDNLDPMRQCVRAVRPSARRILRRLTSLYENGEAVAIDAIDMLPELGRVSSELVSFATKNAQRVAAYALEVHGSIQRVDPAQIVSIALESMHAVLPGDTLDPIFAHSETLATSIDALLAGAFDQDNVISIAVTEPWRARALELGAMAQQEALAVQHAAELEERIIQLGRDVRAREDKAQASRVKIELLEHQLDRAHEAASAAADLRIALEAANEALEMERSAGVAVAESDEPPRAPADVLAELDGVRRALHHVRQENIFMKSSSLHRLKPLAGMHHVDIATPTTAEPGKPRAPKPPAPAQALQELAGQLVQLAAAPKVVDLRAGGRGWRPAQTTPAGQLAAQRRSRASAQWHMHQLEVQLAQ